MTDQLDGPHVDEAASADPDPKKALTNLLQDSGRVADEGLEKSQQIAEAYAEMGRKARLWLPLVPFLTGKETEETLERWSNYYGTGTYGLQKIGGVQGALGSSGSALGFYTTDSVETTVFVTRIENSGSTIAIDALKGLQELNVQTANGEKVIGLMRSLGLTERFSEDKLSPLEEYQVALRAQRRPVSVDPVPAATSLIPLRSSIDASIDQLLKRRRNKTKLPSGRDRDRRWLKVKTIGKDLKHDAISEDTPTQWATDCYNLFEQDLHPSKEAKLTMTEWDRAFRRGTLFLLAFLGGLDQSKLS